MTAQAILFVFLVGIVSVCNAATYYFNVTDDDESDIRIVNGNEAPRNAYPFMASLSTTFRQEGESYMCGGSLINANYVLTAAHCVYHPENGRVADQIDIVLGAHNADRQEAGQLRVKAVQLTVDRYDKNTHYGDIALLKLNQAVRMTGQISPICIPRYGARFDSVMATAAGWGALGSNRPTSPVLRHVTLPILPDSSCSRPYTARGMQYYDEVMLCAGFADGSKDTCQGDSGGPLFAQGNNGYVIIGATSFGYGCAARGFPGVYAEVSRYSNWIQSKAGSVCVG